MRPDKPDLARNLALSMPSKCPNCGRWASRTPYDIGSGPEYSCADCEWCWGALGQPLNASDTDWHPHTTRRHPTIREKTE